MPQICGFIRNTLDRGVGSGNLWLPSPENLLKSQVHASGRLECHRSAANFSHDASPLKGNLSDWLPDAYALSVLYKSFSITCYVLIRVIPCTGDAAYFVCNHVASTHECVAVSKAVALPPVR